MLGINCGLNRNVCLVLTTVFTVFVGWQLSGSQTTGTMMKPDIGGDIISTLRIVVALCFSPGDHSEKVARPFFACYDQAPGKEIFIACQKKAYGVALDTPKHIDKACQNSQQIPSYAMCLQRKFRKAGISMPIAVTLLNVCQGKVLRL